MSHQLVAVFWRNSSPKYLLIVSCLMSFLVGCQEQKYSQCQELIAIANKVTHQAKKIANTSESTIGNMTTWLQAADTMTLAAQEITALPIKDPQLINYQENLANLFNVYSQSTYDAVEAREHKNFSGLKLAHDNAQQIGKLNQDLVAKINSYCQF